MHLVALETCVPQPALGAELPSSPCPLPTRSRHRDDRSSIRECSLFSAGGLLVGPVPHSKKNMPGVR